MQICFLHIPINFTNSIYQTFIYYRFHLMLHHNQTYIQYHCTLTPNSDLPAFCTPPMCLSYFLSFSRVSRLPRYLKLIYPLNMLKMKSFQSLKLWYTLFLLYPGPHHDLTIECHLGEHPIVWKTLDTPLCMYIP